MRIRHEENIYVYGFGLHSAHVPYNSQNSKIHNLQSGTRHFKISSLCPMNFSYLQKLLPIVTASSPNLSVTAICPHLIPLFTFMQVRAIFGFTPSDNIGKSAFPAVQACPAFPSTFHIPLKGSLDMPCLIPCAIDQVRTTTSTPCHG